MGSGHLCRRLGDRFRSWPPDVRGENRPLLGPVSPGNYDTERLIGVGCFANLFHLMISVWMCHAHTAKGTPDATERNSLKSLRFHDL